jgi:hypothetical protein
MDMVTIVSKMAYYPRKINVTGVLSRWVTEILHEILSIKCMFGGVEPSASSGEE